MYSLRQRIAVERKIVRKLFSLAKEHGLVPEYVYDGDEYIKGSQNMLIEHIFDLDECRIYFEDKDKEVWGVFLVFGNDGWDTVSDYHLAPAGHPFNEVMQKLNKYTEQFE